MTPRLPLPLPHLSLYIVFTNPRSGSRTSIQHCRSRWRKLSTGSQTFKLYLFLSLYYSYVASTVPGFIATSILYLEPVSSLMVRFWPKRVPSTLKKTGPSLGWMRSEMEMLMMAGTPSMFTRLSVSLSRLGGSGGAGEGRPSRSRGRMQRTPRCWGGTAVKLWCAALPLSAFQNKSMLSAGGKCTLSILYLSKNTDACVKINK